MAKSKSIRQQQIHNTIVKWLRKVFVALYNLYGYYWLYKLIFVIKSHDWEHYALWFFAMATHYFYILDNRKKLGIEDYHTGVE